MSDASTAPAPDEPLPMGVLADTGERLSPIHDEVLDFFAGLSGDADNEALAGKRQASTKHLGVDDDAGDPDALDGVGWAILYGSAVSDGIKKKLKPLIDHRRGQVGNDALFKIFDGPDAYASGDTVVSWLAKNGKNVANARVDPNAGVPYYVLIVASPEDVPFDFQFGLDLHWAVGRVWFDNEEDFGRYAESVVAYETAGSVPTSRQLTVFSPRNGQDAAMNLLCDKLAAPMLQPTATKPPFGAQQKFRPQSFIGDPATRETLDRIWRGKIPGGPPAVLFTGSHGMAFFSGDVRQTAEQGAIVCGDWAGVDPPKASTYCAAKDVPADAHVHGMIHILFACYGAGWPKYDTYSEMAERHSLVAPAPAMSRLPQRLLAHPNGGALAVMAHVDRAWSSSYCSKDISRIEGFRTVMNRLMSGKRVGNAIDAWNENWAFISADLVQEMRNFEEGFGDRIKLKNLWITRDDARNYIVFGDPAVQLRTDKMPVLS